jgi:molybdopterin biosynthesis enzyme
MGFGQIGDCPVVTLPGNPVAAFVCFLLYVRPMLVVMGGGIWPEPQRFEVRLPSNFRRARPGGASSCAASSFAAGTALRSESFRGTGPA